MTEQGRFRTLRIPQFVTQRDAVKYSLPLYFDNTNVSKTIKNFYKNPTARTSLATKQMFGATNQFR